MKKRVTAGLLWFYAGWCVGTMVAFALGLSGVLGPILGVAFAAVVAGDPRRLIWHRATGSTTAMTTGTQVQTQA